jgi:hypothetical protein
MSILSSILYIIEAQQEMRVNGVIVHLSLAILNERMI